MANSIPFDEWTALPNNVLDKLALWQGFSTETRVKFCLIRAVLGWEDSRIKNQAAIGVRTIINRTKASQRSVIIAVDSLEKQGWLSVDRSGSKTGKYNKYSINLDLLQSIEFDLVQSKPRKPSAIKHDKPSAIKANKPSAIKTEKASAIDNDNDNPDLVQNHEGQLHHPSAISTPEEIHPSAIPVREKTHIKKHTKETIKEKDNAAYGSGSDKPSPTAVNEPTENITSDQIQRIYAAAKEKGISANMARTYMVDTYQKNSTKELTSLEANQLLQDINNGKVATWYIYDWLLVNGHHPMTATAIASEIEEDVNMVRKALKEGTAYFKENAGQWTAIEKDAEPLAVV